MNKKKNLGCLLLLFSLIGLPLLAQQTLRSDSEDYVLEAERMTGDLRRPWALAFLPNDGGMLITERGGRLWFFYKGQLTAVQGMPSVAAQREAGLLDVALSPQYTTDRWVYFSYAEAGQGALGFAVARGQLSFQGGPHLENLDVIFSEKNKRGGSTHFGSRLVFDSDGLLYVSLGDEGRMARSQDRRDPAGSLLRLNPDGSIPPDNPFVGVPGVYEGIYSYGHRNAQGLAFHPESGALWSHEHGPKGGDELNLILAGANYGWPTVTYGLNYNGTVISNRSQAPGIEAPLVYWTPSIAPSGMTFYTGKVFSRWKNNIFLGALAGQHLRRLELDGNKVIHQEVLFKRELGRIRDVREGPDGLLYLLIDSKKGAVYRLSLLRKK